MENSEESCMKIVIEDSEGNCTKWLQGAELREAGLM
jgi:hypothetical protein